VLAESDCTDTPIATFLAEAKDGALRVKDLVPLAHGRALVCVNGVAIAAVDPVAPCPFALSVAPCASPACIDNPSGDACQQVAAEYCFANPTLDACAMLLPRFERKEGKSSIDVHVAATTLFASDATCKCGCPTPANVTLHPEKVELEATAGEYFLCEGETPLLAVDVVPVPVLCLGDGFQVVCDLCAADPQSDKCLKAFTNTCTGSSDPACALVIPVFERVAGEPATVSFHQDVSPNLMVTRCESCPGDVLDQVTYDDTTKLVIVTFVPPSENRVYLVSDGSVVAIVDVLKPRCQEEEAAVCMACADGPTDVCEQSMAEYCAATESSVCDVLLVKFVRPVGESEIVVHTGDVSIVEASCGCGCAPPAWVGTRMEVNGTDTRVLKLSAARPGLLTACEGAAAVFDVEIIGPNVPCLLVEGGVCAQEACADPGSEACLRFLGVYCIDGVDKACDLIVPRYERTAGVISTIPIYRVQGEVSVVRAECSCAEDCPAASVLTPSAKPQGGFFDATILFHEGGAGKVQAAVCVAGTRVAVVDVIAPNDACFLGGERPCDACAENPYSEICQLKMAEYCASPASQQDACEILLLVFERVVGETAPLVLHTDHASGEARVVVRECGCAASCGSPLASVWTNRTDEQTDELLTLHILFSAAGEVGVCVGSELLAVVNAVERNAVCVFSADGTPCTSSACEEDPSSLKCQQIMAEYCATESAHDQACSLILPLLSVAWERTHSAFISRL
jgi:hypothetical protein